jgi:signal peptidase
LGRRGLLKDVGIVVVGVLIIWFGLKMVTGTDNPFYVVSSGSMVPVLEVYDVLIVDGKIPFEEVEVGDIIVFNRPSGNDRVIVHRVAAIMDEDPFTIRTKGDANPASIPGTDFPITEEEYIGKVAHILPQVGYVTQLLKPPVNYVIIAIVIGIMVIKQITKKKKEKMDKISDLDHSENPDTIEELSDINKIEKDSEYSEHVEKSDISEDKKDRSVKETKTDDISEKDNKE